MRYIFFFLFVLISTTIIAQEVELKGSVLCNTDSYDYSNNQCSTSANTANNVFDGKFDTFFSSCQRSGAWVGLDLGMQYIITKVGYAPRDIQPERLFLGVIEGANRPDFSDAVPLTIIQTNPPANKYTYSIITHSRGFRYVRYTSPDNVRCCIAELKFFGIQGEGDYSNYTQLTNLPTVVITTENGADIISKDKYLNGRITIISDDGVYSDALEVKGRGNYSWTTPKKPYRLKLDKKASLLGMKATQKNWTLINNYGDKTLMRNLLAFDLSERMGLPYTPQSRSVDLIVNGEYKGSYQLTDQIEVSTDRVDIEKMTPADIALPNLSGGYLIEMDAYADTEISMFYSASKRIPVTIKYPKDDEIVPEQSNYIKNYFNKMESTLFSASYTHPTSGFRKYLDTETFLKHFIVGELSGNTDTYWSVYMYKDRESDLFRVGPVWDFDLAFENDSRTYPINNLNDYIYKTNGSCANGVREFVNRVMSDVGVKADLTKIWSIGRLYGGIDKITLLNRVDEYATLLDQSQQLNFKRWPILNQYVHQNPVVRYTYQAEVKNVKEYISKRLDWLDKKIGLDTSLSIDVSSLNNGVVYGAHSELYFHNFPRGSKAIVYTPTGGVVLQSLLDQETSIIRVSSGIYIVVVSFDGVISHHKVIVQ